MGGRREPGGGTPATERGVGGRGVLGRLTADGRRRGGGVSPPPPPRTRISSWEKMKFPKENIEFGLLFVQTPFLPTPSSNTCLGGGHRPPQAC